MALKWEKKTRLQCALYLSILFFLIEVAGGLWSNSLAVLSDAAHMFTDVAGFGVALAATMVAERPGCKDYTYGLARAEVLGALLSVASLWVITAILLFNAYVRTVQWFDGEAEPVDGCIMFIVACFGVGVNILLGLVFMEDHGGSMSAHG
jgi:solute carrier family 30 (zinc transporter), member 2